MRYEPSAVYGIPRNSTAQMIINAALRDFRQGLGDCLEQSRFAIASILRVEESEDGTLWKFRCAAETAMREIDGAQIGRCRLSEKGRIEFVGDILLSRLGQCGAQGVGIGRHLDALIAPQAGYLGQDMTKARPTVAALRWEVGSAPEGLAFWREEHGQRPAALFAEAMECLHIDAVDVGALFAVNLDIDEVGVHESGGLRILETLMRHDMAPMAGGVTNRQQDRAFGVACLGEGRFPPWHPVNRIVAVLQEIGACFGTELVHGLSLCRKLTGAKKMVDSLPK